MGLTQDQLANKLGYSSNSTLAAWEKGKKVPTTEMLVAMSKIFSCSLDDLVFGSNSDDYKEKYFKTLEDLSALQKKYNDFYEEVSKQVKRI